MTAKKRTRQAPAVTRAQLLDATEHIMVTEGYAAVSTRRVASEVGLTAALVHYYFPTTGDLLVAAYHRAVERHDERIRQALVSDRPLHALWNLLTDSSHMALGVEFAALANHRKHIRNEIAKHDERCRRFQVRALSRILGKPNVDAQLCSPLCLVMLMDGMSRSFVIDKTLGSRMGTLKPRILSNGCLTEWRAIERLQQSLGHRQAQAQVASRFVQRERSVPPPHRRASLRGNLGLLIYCG